MDEVRLSEYGGASVSASPVARMMAEFAGDFRDGVDINLGVGYVNELAIPTALIEQALHAVLSQPRRYRQAMNYGSAAGSGNLVAALRRYLVRHGGVAKEVLRDREVIVGLSGATSLLAGLGHVMERGVVLTSEPRYYIYTDVLERLGHRVVAVAEDGEGIRVDLLRGLVESGAVELGALRFVYVVTVANPTCTMLSNERRRELVRFVEELSDRARREVVLVLDGSYEGLVHDPGAERPESALGWDERGLVYEVGSLSKVVAPALRLGYLVGRQGPLVRSLVQWASDVGFSAPLFAQEIGSYILDHHMEDQLRHVQWAYRDKAQRVRRWIEEELGRYLETVQGGQAGFYYYLTFRSVRTEAGSEFFRYLTRTTGDAAVDEEGGKGPGQLGPRVIYLPGRVFVGAGSELWEAAGRQLRLSYGFESLERLRVAVRWLGRAAEYAAGRSGECKMKRSK